MSAINFERGLKKLRMSKTGRVTKNTTIGIRFFSLSTGFIRCHATNVKNKESKIADKSYAISAAVTQYSPRLMRARAIRLPQGNKTFTIRESGKVAENTPLTIRIFLRCKL
jgi:hypothetical protein